MKKLIVILMMQPILAMAQGSSEPIGEQSHLIGSFLPFITLFVIVGIFLLLKTRTKKIEKIGADLGESDTVANYKISFRGNGKTFFKIWIANLFLTICTLGIYYPWGRANTKKYLYSSTYLGDYSFEFHGTGKQMFFGLIKFLTISALMFLIFSAVYTYLVPEDKSFFEHLSIEKLILEEFYFIFLTLILYAPTLALFTHGSRRYKMSKTSYRGVRFGYRGNKKSLILLFLKGMAFSFATLGIYYPWYINKVRQYIYGNTRFGNIESNFNGKGFSYAVLLLVNGLFIILTVSLILSVFVFNLDFNFLYYIISVAVISFYGICYFLFRKKLFNFFWKNLSFGRDEKFLKIRTKVTVNKLLDLILINSLILIFTLGLGYPFAKVRSMRFIADNLELYGNLDLDNVTQTEKIYSDATGEVETDMDDSADFFDLDIF
jgi:uncharacterized membrane protein YjgN (DUF898 family)